MFWLPSSFAKHLVTMSRAAFDAPEYATTVIFVSGPILTVNGVIVEWSNGCLRGDVHNRSLDLSVYKVASDQLGDKDWTSDIDCECSGNLTVLSVECTVEPINRLLRDLSDCVISGDTSVVDESMDREIRNDQLEKDFFIGTDISDDWNDCVSLETIGLCLEADIRTDEFRGLPDQSAEIRLVPCECDNLGTLSRERKTDFFADSCKFVI